MTAAVSLTTDYLACAAIEADKAAFYRASAAKQTRRGRRVVDEELAKHHDRRAEVYRALAARREAEDHPARCENCRAPLGDGRFGETLAEHLRRRRRCHRYYTETRPMEIDYTEQLIRAVETAAEAAGRATAHVQALEDGRPAEKTAAIQRLMATINPETQKPHSASSAEKVVETDREYAEYRQEQAHEEVAKWRALGAYEAAKLRALRAVQREAITTATAGV